MLGSEYVLEAVRSQGTDHCFMVPGGLDDDFMGPMTGTGGLTTVVAAFEGGAAYMADGYARASGGLGLCFGIGGPGVLNMATALAAARADRSPVLAVSGEVPTSWEGLGGFQDASGAALDDLDALRPLTGASLSVSSPAVLPHHLRMVMTHALTEREPVHLSVPVDVQRAEIAEPWTPLTDGLVHPRHLDEDALAGLVSVLERPDVTNVVLLAGHGVNASGAAEDLVELAERYDLPVATTLGGKGVFPEDHPLALGVFGYGGSRWATEAILDDAVQVLVVLGSGLSQRDTLQWDRRMLPSVALAHVDADPLVIGRTWQSEVPIVGDCRTALRRLRDAGGTALEHGRAARRAFLADVLARGPRCYDDANETSDAVPLHPARVVSELRGAFGDDTVLCVDSGAHRAWFAEYWDARGIGNHLSLTNLGPMGGAVPLGIGAALARPDRPLVVATGDGCMLMHGMELHTAARYGVPVVVALMDNRSYGNIWYRARSLGDGPESLTDIPGMDWVGFARSVGADGELVEHPDQLRAAAGRARASQGPYVLDLRVDKRPEKPLAPWQQAVQHWEDDH